MNLLHTKGFVRNISSIGLIVTKSYVTVLMMSNCIHKISKGRCI